MKGWNEQGTGSKVAVVAAVGIAVAAVAYVWLRPPPPAISPQVPAANLAPPAGAPAAATQPASQTAPAASAPAVTPAPATPAAVPAPVVPSFDIVRVTPDGSATVAGRAEGGATVDVKVDDTSAATAPVDSGGHFAALFSLPPSDQPRVVTLTETLSDGTKLASTQSVIIAPTTKFAAEMASAAPATVASEATAGAAATATPATGASAAPTAPATATTAATPSATGASAQPEAAGSATSAPSAVANATGAQSEPQTTAAADQPAQTASAAATSTAPAAVPGAISQMPPLSSSGSPAAAPSVPAKSAAPAEGGAVTTAQAPAVLLTDKGSVSVMQPAEASAEAMQNIGIDAIAYSGTGAVELSGHGAASANVRIYIDNAPVITAPIGADGKWKLTLPELHEGVYTLRADQIDAAGKVTSRFETPFKRESATALTSAGMIGGPSVGVRAAIITVQPGYTLWGIARANLGSGILYVKVFAANRDQIRNPDLIYPGQVFAVPGSN